MDSSDHEHFDRRASNPRKPTVVPRASSGRNRIDCTPSCCNAWHRAGSSLVGMVDVGNVHDLPERSTRNQKRCASIGSSKTGVVCCGTSGRPPLDVEVEDEVLVDLQRVGAVDAEVVAQLAEIRLGRRRAARRGARRASRVDIDVTSASSPTRNAELRLGLAQPRLRLETRSHVVAAVRGEFRLRPSRAPCPIRRTSYGFRTPVAPATTCGRMSSWTACTTSVGCKASARSKSSTTSRCSTNRGSVGPWSSPSAPSSPDTSNGGQFRHSIERMDAAHYLDSSYYEHWTTGVATRMVELGLLTVDELEQRAGGAFPLAGPDRGIATDRRRRRRRRAALRRRRPRPRAQLASARAHPLPAVRARPAGNHRSRIDIVASVPDIEAHSADQRSEPTYSVRFESDELWGEPGDPVHVDLWESYLEPIDEH